MNAEEVVIDIIANNKATNVFNAVKSQLQELQSLANSVASSLSNLNNLKNSSTNPNVLNFSPSVTGLNEIGKTISDTSNKLDTVESKISNVKKLLNEPMSSSSKSTNPVIPSSTLLSHSELDELEKDLNPNMLNKAYTDLERIRQISQNSIRFNVDSSLIKKTSEETRRANNFLNTLKQNAHSSFFNTAGRGGNLIPYQGSVVPSQTGMPTIPPSTSNELVNISKSANESAKSMKNASKEASGLGKQVNDAGKVSTSSFHQLNNMMVTVGAQFHSMSAQLAGLFGAAGFSGMIEKMWKGAAERQTNMLFLIHQKGVDEANAYYDEIMDIVTQLPGDDTFLTNILNMMSAMDKNIDISKLKELGTAITDYSIAASMKGELPFETQKDLRKYLTQGDTRSLRNSLLASEIDSLKNKNSILERGLALEKALDKLGFSGMSKYESATNALEELKGHFQKAFADIGGIVIAITQPIMKFYNMMDTVFGSRISQLIIIVATAFIFLFAVIGTGMIMIPMIVRNFEIVGLAMSGLSAVVTDNAMAHGFLNAMLYASADAETRKMLATEGNIIVGIKETVSTIKSTVARMLYNRVVGQSSKSLFVETLSLLKNIATKGMRIILTIKGIIFGVAETDVTAAKTVIQSAENGAIIDNVSLRRAQLILVIHGIHQRMMDTLSIMKNTLMLFPNIVATKLKTGASWKEATASVVNRLATESETFAYIKNSVEKVVNYLISLKKVIVGFIEVGIKVLTTDATIAEAVAEVFGASAKMAGTVATLELAGATFILDMALAPIIVTIGAIVAIILVLIVAVEKVGELFGWWKDFKSMFDAISDGINRIWNAFMHSDVIQGIIQYFRDFFDTVKEVIGTVFELFGRIFNFDMGDFDIVQVIINMFTKLGEVVKWVWNILDDWSNSPLGIITWITPLGILLFHLDEIGSFLEDVRDAIDEFTNTTEFQEMVTGLGEAFDALKEPFQEIWDLVTEIFGLIGEIFSSEDPVGQGTEDRVNAIVGVFKTLAWIISTFVVPAIKGLAFVIRIVLTPLRVVLTVVKTLLGIIKGGVGTLDIFGSIWSAITDPISFVKNAIDGIINAVKSFIGMIENSPVGDFLRVVLNPVVDALMYMAKVLGPVLIPVWEALWNTIGKLSESIVGLIDGIKNSPLGKLLGWDKDSGSDSKKKRTMPKTDLSDSVHKNREINDDSKQKMLRQTNLAQKTNVRDAQRLGSTYNHNNNQKQVVVNNNFAEGSMPIDARNMTKKEARKMFIGAFGYRRAVGYNGILK